MDTPAKTHPLEAMPKSGTEVNVACDDCGGTGMRDSGGFQPWGEAIFVPCDCKPAPAYGYQCTFDCNTQFERVRAATPFLQGGVKARHAVA